MHPPKSPDCARLAKSIAESARPRHASISKEPFDSKDDAYNALMHSVVLRGLTVVSCAAKVADSGPEKGNKVKFTYSCSRGRSTQSTSIGLRHKSSRRIKCPFRATVVLRQRQGRKWFVTETNSNDNHPLDFDRLVGDAVFSRWQRSQHREDVEAAVERLSNIAQITSGQIANYLCGSDDFDLTSLDTTLRAVTIEKDDAFATARSLRILITAQQVRNI